VKLKFELNQNLKPGSFGKDFKCIENKSLGMFSNMFEGNNGMLFWVIFLNGNCFEINLGK
jgi:hypothetical protein